MATSAKRRLPDHADDGAAPAKRPRAASKIDTGEMFSLNDVSSVAPGACGMSLRRAVLGDAAVLADDAVVRAVVSSYLTDVDYLLQEVPELATLGPQCILLMQKPRTPQDAIDLRHTGFRVVHPPLPFPYGTHHSKFFIVEFKTRLRVCITSANLVRGDWERKAQSIWCQDFPRFQPGEHGQVAQQRPNDFGQALASYLCSAGLEQRLVEQMLTPWALLLAQAYLVTSVPGRHTGHALRRYGHMRVRSLLSRLAHLGAADHAARPALLAQCSSLGQLRTPWLEEFETSLSASAASGLGTRGRLQIVWPSVDFVRGSVDGWAAGNSIPCPARNLTPITRARLVPFRPIGVRRRVPPHIKTYTRVSTDSQHVPWLITGSHNVSPAAWGTLQRNASQLFIRHWEVSVLLVSERDCGYPLAQTPMPYPITPPPPLPGYREDEEPWAWDVPRLDVDAVGAIKPIV